jgi:hypothetical protein
MTLRDDWEMPRRGRGWHVGAAGMGAVRVALLFGSAAVALALIFTPMLEDRTRKMTYSAYPAGVDMMATGSIGQRANPGAYTIRRSVLQPSPNAVCIIRDNGMRTGDC